MNNEITKTKNNKKNIRCAIYTRKSDQDGFDHYITSVEAQREASRIFIKAQHGMSWFLLPERYDDEGYSGKTSDRPAFNRLKQDIINQKIDLLVVYRFDRLSRNVADNIYFDEFLKMHKVEVVSVMEGFNTNNTAIGNMSRYTAMVHAQYERELAVERTLNKIVVSKRAGLWMGGTVPLGYNAVNKQLVINQKDAIIIRFIFDYFIKTESVTKTVEVAQRNGYKTKKRKTYSGIVGGNKINKGSVYNILNNVTYIGKIAYKNEIYEGRHDAIISEEQWNKAQALLKERYINQPVYKKKSKTPAYLCGILQCGKCRSGMVLHSTTKKKTGKQYRYYTPNACIKKICKTCPVNNLHADKIESLVFEYLGFALKTGDIIAHVLEKLKIQSTHYSEKHVIAALSSFEDLWQVLSNGDKYKTIRGICRYNF